MTEAEREDKLAETMLKAIPVMSDFDRGYFFGKAETLLAQEETEVQEKAEEMADESKCVLHDERASGASCA